MRGKRFNMGLFDQIKGDLEKAFGNAMAQSPIIITNAQKIKENLTTSQNYLSHTQQSFDAGEIDYQTYTLLKEKYETEIKDSFNKLKKLKIDYKTAKHQTEQRLIKNKGEIVVMEKDLDQTMKMYEKGLIPEPEYKKKTNFLPSKIKQLQNQIMSDEQTLIDLEKLADLFQAIGE